jgi:hypothetical protein
MHGNALGSEPLTSDCGFGHIGDSSSSGISDCGYLVDIDTEFCHFAGLLVFKYDLSGVKNTKISNKLQILILK